MSSGRARCPGSKSKDELEELDFGAEIDDFGGKIAEISWMESGEKWRKARSTSNKQIHGSKSTKHHQTNKSQKNGGRGSKFVINVVHDTKMM